MTAQLSNAVSTSLAAAAVDLARAGWSVFPSKPGTKLPAITEWPDKATTDVGQVTRWWRQWPDANISHVPGKSGSFVLDLDGPTGFASWRHLQSVHGAAPSTLAVLSPRDGGGVHLYWQAPAGVYVKSTASKLAAGIDVRGTRGQAVLPPSVRSDGTAYRWADPNIRPALPPRWLLALLNPPPPPVRVTKPTPVGQPGDRLVGLVRTIVNAPEGQLNHTLHWAACRGGEIAAEHGGAEAIAEALLKAAVDAGHPSSGARGTIRSGMSKSGIHVGGHA
ncbi:hypothetical protein BH23ACT9_BH23ACT9_34180 [soil metagenome]